MITGACELAYDRIRELVFIDALMPRDRQCNLEIVGPPVASAIRELTVNGWCVSPPPDAPLAYRGIEYSSDRHWVAGRFLSPSLRTFDQPFWAFSGNAAKTPRLTFAAQGPAADLPTKNSPDERSQKGGDTTNCPLCMKP